jgi:prepilin-type N-terminal cleavage/methylation domain-containing protein
MTHRNRLVFRRRGFTLVEMLVALAILTVIATLSIAVIPKIKERTKASAGADNLQQWLLIAKQWALRDRAPRGVRLLVDTDGFVRSLQYIEQPDNFTGGVLNFNPNNASQVIISGVDLSGGFGLNQTLWPVQSWFIDAGTGQVRKEGDYLQIQNGPAVRITGVTPGTGALAGSWLVTTSTPVWTSTSATPPTLPPTTNYTIIRTPRPIAGQDPLRLPDDVVIDSWQSRPSVFVVSNVIQPFDILFSPSGPLTGRLGNNFGKIILWVRDSTQDPDQPGDQPLVVVFGRTGRIGAVPINPNPLLTLDPTDPNAYWYYYASDPRNSGL